jgi:hypothetical protein
MIRRRYSYLMPLKQSATVRWSEANELSVGF